MRSYRHRFAILAIVLMPALAVPAYAAPSPVEPVLRVGLLRTFGRARTVTVQAPEGATLTCANGATIAGGLGAWRFAVSSGAVTVRCEPGGESARSSLFRVDPADGGDPLALTAPGVAKAARYRGSLEVRAANGGSRLLVVNVVALEDYLRGVIAPEMGADAPVEALKAQAICARTHAVKSCGRYRDAPYDVVDTTSTQVYEGIGAEHASTDAAVRETAGLVLTFDGKLIWGDYYDDCGGVTAPGEDAADYPPSVVDRPPGGDTDYCAHAPHHTWTVVRTLAEIERALPRSVTVRTGTLTGIAVAEADSSGRARRVRLTGASGEADVSGAELRERIGYSRLPSTLFTVAASADGVVTFTGRGSGHGHGMCQQGAIGMASPPYNATCAEILQHYFPGSKTEAYRGPGARAPAGSER